MERYIIQTPEDECYRPYNLTLFRKFCFYKLVNRIRYESVKKKVHRASLVAQWLGIRLPMQGTQVCALVREDPTCRGAARPMSHNY